MWFRVSYRDWLDWGRHEWGEVILTQAGSKTNKRISEAWSAIFFNNLLNDHTIDLRRTRSTINCRIIVCAKCQTFQTLVVLCIKASKKTCLVLNFCVQSQPHIGESGYWGVWKRITRLNLLKLRHIIWCDPFTHLTTETTTSYVPSLTVLYWAYCLPYGLTWWPILNGQSLCLIPLIHWRI